jgi:hypothetical protein
MLIERGEKEARETVDVVKSLGDCRVKAELKEVNRQKEDIDILKNENLVFLQN